MSEPVHAEKKVKVADDPMLNDDVHQPSAACQKGALVSSMEQYRQIYDRSLKHPEEFWKEVRVFYVVGYSKRSVLMLGDKMAHAHLSWSRPFTKVMSGYAGLVVMLFCLVL
jgi:hypothetical protein